MDRWWCAERARHHRRSAFTGQLSGYAGVYEVDSIGLVKVMSRMNQGTDWAGKNLGGATNFTIGVAVNPLAEDLDEELRRFDSKVEAGAHFAMTQPIFDPEHWEQFVRRMGGKSPIPVLVGIWPLSSYKQAMRLHNEVPGIVIPEPLLKQLEAAGGSARDHGFRSCTRLARLGKGRAKFGNCRRVPDSTVQTLRGNSGSVS